ncbi:MAG: hypothetical protein RLZZ427_1314, partial [Pseudomonadota bacterium]
PAVRNAAGPWASSWQNGKRLFISGINLVGPDRWSG